MIWVSKIKLILKGVYKMKHTIYTILGQINESYEHNTVIEITLKNGREVGGVVNRLLNDSIEIVNGEGYYTEVDINAIDDVYTIKNNIFQKEVLKKKQVKVMIINNTFDDNMLIVRGKGFNFIKYFEGIIDNDILENELKRQQIEMDNGNVEIITIDKGFKGGYKIIGE